MSNDYWDNAVTGLASELIDDPDEFSAEKTCPCPVCGNRLEIHMGRYQRDIVKMIGVTIECNKCSQAVAIDSVDPGS